MSTNEIISYDLSLSPNLEQIQRMLNKAFKKFPDVNGLILHSDQGWQYQHAFYQQSLKERGIIQSMSRKGNCYDNCIIETFFARMKNEMFYGLEKQYSTFKEFQTAVKDYIDYYNYNGWGTISAVDCNQMEGLAEAVRSVILSNQDSLKNVDIADLQQYGKGSSNFKGYAYDMLQFIEKLCGGMAPDDFTQQLKKTVIYTDYTHDPTHPCTE